MLDLVRTYFVTLRIRQVHFLIALADFSPIETGSQQNWGEARDNIPGTGNLEIYVFSPWSKHDTGEPLTDGQFAECADAQSQHHSLPEYCSASLQSSAYCAGDAGCHPGLTCRGSKIKKDSMGILFGAVVQAGKDIMTDLVGTCVHSILTE